MFSVIIPVYNKAAYLTKCLESVFKQTLQDFEVILVNDGSTDHSEQLLDGIQKSHVNCRVITQENQGVSAARNNGIKVAAREFIAFLDADDWWEPGYLEAIKSVIQAYPQAGIYATGYFIVKHGNRKAAPVGVPAGFSTGLIDYFETYGRNLCMPLWTGAVVLKKQVISEAGGFHPGLRLGEDFHLWARIALKHPVAFLNQPLSNYNQDVDKATRAVGHLHHPSHHFLFNLDFLSGQEKQHPDLKRLLDKMRVYGLFPYMLDRRYRALAQAELKRVDRTAYTLHDRLLYALPRPLQVVFKQVLALGSGFKQQARRIFSDSTGSR